jgi:hypothetical protein
MSHVRAQIREFIRTKLQQIVGLEQSVYIDSAEIPEAVEIPVALVELGDELIQTTGLGDPDLGRRLVRDMQVFVDLYCQAKKEPLLACEDYAVKVEAVLSLDPRLGGLAKDLRLTAYSIERSDAGAASISRLRMPWTVTYITNERDATVPA